MNDIKEKAIQSFRAGYNCAQAVVTAYSDKCDFDKELSAALSCGFGAGMGRMQETCGAVTGAFMVIGVYSYRKLTDPVERKEYAYPLIREFNKRFMERHGTTSCRVLLNCDILTDEGRQYIKDHNLHENVCEKCILTSVDMINDILVIEK